MSCKTVNYCVKIRIQVKSLPLTNNQITLSIKEGKILFGTWQGLYIFEHKLKSQRRKIVFHFMGN